MKNAILFMMLFFLAVEVAAQNEAETFLPLAPKPVRTDLPIVYFDADNRLLMKAFYPEYYSSDYLIAREIRWVNRNDSSFIAVWDSLKYDILGLITDYSGIAWQENSIRIGLMKYLRTNLLYDPPCFPLEGIRRDNYIEATPTGMHQLFDLIKLLAGRNLMQYELPGNENDPISLHPLMEKSAFRFDVLALTLAMACAEQIIPPDSLEEITRSASWKRHNPGWDIYQNHFRFSWVLTPEEPLLFYLSREPYDSPLVGLTRVPRPSRRDIAAQDSRKLIKMSAGGGRLGFSVAKTPTGLLEVIDVDSLGMAYASGLMPGDLIKRVNGEIVRNARDLMGKILDKLDTEGIYMIIVREGRENGLLFIPYEEQY
ncbi:MAG: hypothetical protein DRP46_06055 [Candidatus Zixiibacteriota bacterium]|nr:MAG: hypothetical protein DRP46_06055 [candidate division Zixibacteria bacterium]